MHCCSRNTAVHLKLVDPYSEEPRTNNQEVVDGRDNGIYGDRNRCGGKGGVEPVTLVCTEPIPMTITCIHKCDEDEGPVGRITRNQDFDLIASKFVYRCTCAARNGLDPECKRVACQSNPGCKMQPPRCWPQYRPKPEQRRQIEGPIRLCYYIDDGANRLY